MSYGSLEQRRNIYLMALERNNEEIRRYNNLLDSLKRFKTEATESAHDFYKVSSEKMQVAVSFTEYADKCKTAKTYAEYMGYLLEEYGNKVYYAKLLDLLEAIDSKIADYQQKIRELEEGNRSLREKIRQIEEEIRRRDEASTTYYNSSNKNSKKKTAGTAIKKGGKK